jgi:hypothetical protein
VSQDYEVVPNPEGGWRVIANGASKAASQHGTKDAAHAEARRLAQNAGGGEVRIRGMGGEILESDTIAKPHPFRPRG